MADRTRGIETTRDRRRRQAWRPAAVEALEGRALLTLSPVAPAFNGGVAAVSPAIPDTTSPNTAQAVAVGSAGRIVVAAVTTAADLSVAADSLTVLRYNADGAVDTTFGAGGRAVINPPSATLRGFYASN